MLFEDLPFLFYETFRFEIHTDVESGNGGAEHLAIFTIDGAAFGIEGLYTLVKTVAHAAPVRTLEPLDIKGAPEHYNTQCDDTQEAEVYPPQYVTFYFQCPRLTRPPFAGIVISVPVRCSC